MKNTFLHFAHRSLAFIVVIVIMIIGYEADHSLFMAPRAESATTVNVLGYAWANTPQSSGAPGDGANQGLGWISMNGSNYGVTMDIDTGNFSGYAWIGNGDDGAGSTGWVDFAPTTGYPSAPSHGVKKEGNILTGWAKVISMGDDGWIKMSKDASDGGANYGVMIGADGTFSGFAWGSDMIGWVDFAPATAGGNGARLDLIACTAGQITPSGGSWGPCNADTAFSCDGKAIGTLIPGIQIGTCGSGYTGTAPQSCVTGKSCGSVCSVDANCGGGETCLPGTLKCGSVVSGCGNGTCNAGETILTCPQDCRGTIKQF